MALIPSTLQSGFREIFDEDYTLFVGFPGTSLGASNSWATIIDDYAKLVIPVSTGSAAAKAAFLAIFNGINPTAGNGVALLQSALTAYAAALGAGMAPAYIAVPPPIPIDISAVIALGLAGGSGAATSSLLGQLIDTWFRTGTATPSGGGGPIPWS